MNQEEHLAMARELVRRANRESSSGGNEMIAAELLWGAFAHHGDLPGRELQVHRRLTSQGTLELLNAL